MRLFGALLAIAWLYVMIANLVQGYFVNALFVLAVPFALALVVGILNGMLILLLPRR